MEIVLLSLLALLGLISLVGVSFFVGALIGYRYYARYNDRAEVTGVRYSRLFRECLSTGILWVARRYFSYSVQYHDSAAEPYGPVIYAAHPHGLFAIGTLCAAAELDQVVPCIHRLVFAVPLLRELALWFGCVDVSGLGIETQLDNSRSVMLVPGGCREMIREQGVALPDDRRSLERDEQQLFMRLAVVVGTSVLTTVLAVATSAGWKPLLYTQLVIWITGLAMLLSFVAKNAMHESGVYEIQQRHCGFLVIAYNRKLPVVPVLHQGQEQIFRSYSLPRLDRARAWFMDHIAPYPFPSLFLGPFPRRLTTHIYAPLDPHQFCSEKEFIECYYKTVREHYRVLCEQK